MLPDLRKDKLDERAKRAKDKVLSDRFMTVIWLLNVNDRRLNSMWDHIDKIFITGRNNVDYNV